MRLRHVYVQDILNTTTVVVQEDLFSYIYIYLFIYEMCQPMSEKQVKESQSHAGPPLFAQAGIGV